MYAKTVKYTDFNNTERTETFYFNLTKAECLQFELSRNGGISSFIRRIVSTSDQAELMKLFRDFLKMTYGVRSDDGRKFMKSDEIFEDFAATEAYSIIFMELATDAKAASEFIRGVVPKDVASEMAKLKTDENGIPTLPMDANGVVTFPNA